MMVNIPLYMKAAQLTIWLAVCGIACSLLIAVFICAFIIYYKINFLKQVVSGYIELSRNTPLLIQLFFLYYGLPQIGITLSAESCAIIGLSFLGGSYMAESIRSGLEAVDKIQMESGLSIGLTKPQLLRYIILPQAISVSIPSLTANAVFILKETSVLSAIAIADLMYVAKDIIGMYYKTAEAFTLLILFYLIILLPLSIVLSKLERRLRYGQFGH